MRLARPAPACKLVRWLLSGTDDGRSLRYGRADWDSSRGTACVLNLITHPIALALASDCPLRVVAQIPLLIQPNFLGNKLDCDSDRVPRLYVVRLTQNQFSFVRKILENPALLTCESFVS